MLLVGLWSGSWQSLVICVCLIFVVVVAVAVAVVVVFVFRCCLFVAVYFLFN